MRKLIFCLSAIAFLVSCGTKKRLPKDDVEIVTPSVSHAEKSAYESVIAKNFDFETLSARAKYSFNGASLTGKFFVEHQKRICMTMTVLGIEVVRVEANTETITLVNKFDKVYTELTIAEFAEKFGMKEELRFDALECLLIGRMFVPGIGEAKAKDLKAMNLSFDASGSLIGKINKKKYELCYCTTPADDKQLASTEVKAVRDGKEGNVFCKYSNFIQLGNGTFPTTETIGMKYDDIDLKATLSLSAPVLNTKAMSPFKPSAAYQKVSIQEFVEAIKNMKK